MRLTRRRFMTISAAALVAPPPLLAAEPLAGPVVWRGTALGAAASITLSGPDTKRLMQVTNAVQAEISRLEDIFSLYRPLSRISILNREGRLPGPPPEMLELMSLAGAVHEHSSGAFDPTVQPLWLTHAKARAAGHVPGIDALAAARDRTGWHHVRYTPEAISLGRPDMALTFNGIAQGYVADRVSALLEAAGFTDVLVDMGEIAATGQRPGGAPWRVGIAAPDGEIVKRIGLSDRALATSAPEGGLRDSDAHTNHIIDPRDGQPGGQWSLVSVSDRRAVVADALSTVVSLLDQSAARRLLHAFPTARIEHLS